MRYRQLIQKAIDEGTTLREMARAMQLPVASMHNYLGWGTEPRLEALRKMSTYFSEPISVLIGEDDTLTARLITLVRRLSDEEKQRLLDQLEN